MISVPDVFRRMGVEPTPELTWRVGASVRDRFKAETGSLPVKVLRRKTNEPGWHCLAVYPEEWEPIIRATIEAQRIEVARQPDMFGYPEVLA